MTMGKHCDSCEVDPPKIGDILAQIDEAISEDGWFEHSACTMHVLREYIRKLELASSVYHFGSRKA